MSFIVPILAWNVPLLSPVFLKRSLVFAILLFSSVSLYYSFKKAFFSLLAVLWNSAFSSLYLAVLSYLWLLLIAWLFVKPPQISTLPFCISFHLGWFWSLLPVRCYESPSIVLQALCPSNLIYWIYLLLPLYKFKRCDLGHTWMVWLFSLLSSI